MLMSIRFPLNIPFLQCGTAHFEWSFSGQQRRCHLEIKPSWTLKTIWFVIRLALIVQALVFQLCISALGNNKTAWSLEIVLISYAANGVAAGTLKRIYVHVETKNTSWPNDAIRRHRSRSALVQVMACCLTTPSGIGNGIFWVKLDNNLADDWCSVATPLTL